MTKIQFFPSMINMQLKGFFESSNRSKTNLLFFRDFDKLSGGHIKIWQYFQHSLALKLDARIKFSFDSTFDLSNPWASNTKWLVSSDETIDPDLLFIAGYDWKLATSYLDKPVINLIQGFRHLNVAEPLHSYLSYPAHRICVSPELYEAVAQHPATNGPVYCVPNGIDLSELKNDAPWDSRPIDYLVYGIKKPELGKAITQQLIGKGKKTVLIEKMISQKSFFDLLKQSKIVITLPTNIEGFFLPALEAMASGSLVICPDCVGNRSFCKDQFNCLMPKYELNRILDSIEMTLEMDDSQISRLLAKSQQTAQLHSLEQEREKFSNILKGL